MSLHGTSLRLMCWRRSIWVSATVSSCCLHLSCMSSSSKEAPARDRNTKKHLPGLAVIASLAALIALSAGPAVAKRIADMGLEIPPPEQQTQAAFAVYLKAELEKWGAVVRESGIKSQ